VTYRLPGQQIFEQVERRSVQPLQIVEERCERVFRPCEDADEPLKDQLKTALRVLCWKLRNRGLLSDDDRHARPDPPEATTSMPPPGGDLQPPPEPLAGPERAEKPAAAPNPPVKPAEQGPAGLAASQSATLTPAPVALGPSVEPPTLQEETGDVVPF
jgi:hypothetical protein